MTAVTTIDNATSSTIRLANGSGFAGVAGEAGGVAGGVGGPGVLGSAFSAETSPGVRVTITKRSIVYAPSDPASSVVRTPTELVWSRL